MASVACETIGDAVSLRESFRESFEVARVQIIDIGSIANGFAAHASARHALTMPLAGE
jgi:hypothetical protein